jgi:serine/threonine protein kinase
MSDSSLPPPSPDLPTPPPGGLEFTSLTAEQLAPFFPRLEIGAAIAIGGMGAVYRARQPELDRIVALKILPPELCADPEYLDRFRAEARAMAQLNHPNLVGVYDFGEASGYFYFIMEFVEGQNLAELLHGNGSFGPEFALPVLQHVCEGISYAHGKGVVHLDLKPGNIMLNNEGLVKILDFGLAKLLDPATGEVHENMGTPDYAAPERFLAGSAIDHRSDIYSMGIVLYEMLVGKVPRMGAGLPPGMSPAVSGALDAVIRKCTRTDLSLRYNSAAEIKADLAKVEKKVEQELLKSPNAAKLLVNSSSPQVAAAAKKIQRRLRRKMQVKKLRSFAVLVLLLCGLGFGAWKMNLIPADLLAKLGLPAPAVEELPMFAELEKLHMTLGEQFELRVDDPREQAIDAASTNFDASLACL